jgi:vesicular inhibitory amino acid transporter
LLGRADFTWKRCLFRSIVLALVVGVGEALPRFGSIMNLIGGSTITLCTFVFPSVFYMLLVRKCNNDAAGRSVIN